MSKLMINQVAKIYHITKITLRYYEEIGLLTNVKKNYSNYRYYDDETLIRLEQILLSISKQLKDKKGYYVFKRYNIFFVCLKMKEK